jgi:hypothetical protein
MSKERLAQIEAAFAEAKSVEKERICLAPYEADIDWLLSTARAGLEDRERLDWLERHHYDAVSLAVGKAWPKQPLRDAIDGAVSGTTSSGQPSKGGAE